MTTVYSDPKWAFETAKKVLRKAVFICLEAGNDRTIQSDFNKKIIDAFPDDSRKKDFQTICNESQMRFIRSAVHALIDADGNLPEKETAKLARCLHNEVGRKAFLEWLIPQYHQIHSAFLVKTDSYKNADTTNTGTNSAAAPLGRATRGNPGGFRASAARIIPPSPVEESPQRSVPNHGSTEPGRILHPGDPRAISRRKEVPAAVVPESQHRGMALLAKLSAERTGWSNEYASIEKANHAKETLESDIKLHEDNITQLKRQLDAERAQLAAKRPKIETIASAIEKQSLPPKSHLAEGALDMEEMISEMKDKGEPTDVLETEMELWKARHREAKETLGDS